MPSSQFSKILDFQEETARQHWSKSLLSVPIRGQWRTWLLHPYNSFYMKFSICLDKGNVIRELSGILSRYQTAGISLREISPLVKSLAYFKKMLSSEI